MHRILAFILASLAFVCGPALAATYYVAPLDTPINGTPDGSQKLPFPSLGAAFASKKIAGGDTILLMDGAYGDVVVNNQIFDKPVTVAAINRHMAQLDSLLFANRSRNLTFRQLRVVPTVAGRTTGFLVRAYWDTSDITIEDFRILGAFDARNFRHWTAERWLSRQFDGMLMEGARSTLLHNRVLGVRFGIMVSGPDALVRRNVVNGFSGDGLRGTGDNGVFRNNRVYNCVQVDGNHADGFQSFSRLNGTVGAGVVKNLVLDGNVFIEWTDGLMHPLRCALQGIGLFDGSYENAVITNNLVASRAYHGISIYGAIGGKIDNNTVVNVLDTAAKSPWIMVNAHKNGTPSTGIRVTNNLAMSYMSNNSALSSAAGTKASGVSFSRNSVIGRPGAVFLDPATLDYRPKASSGFINAADPSTAPAVDMMRQARPSGGLPDLGAYETQLGAVAASTESLLAEGSEASGLIDGITATGRWIFLRDRTAPAPSPAPTSP